MVGWVSAPRTAEEIVGSKELFPLQLPEENTCARSPGGAPRSGETPAVQGKRIIEQENELGEVNVENEILAGRLKEHKLSLENSETKLKASKKTGFCNKVQEIGTGVQGAEC